MTFTLADINVIEGDEDADHIDVACSLQRAINSGMWSLQGSYGRSMMEAIKSGDCMLGLHRAHDAYGNVIPSRSDVSTGTKGSRLYVVQTYGEEWAEMLEAVDQPTQGVVQ